MSIGFYAVAITVVDFETSESIQPLSRVPIQFLLHIWDSTTNLCNTPPLYLGDVSPDECIFVAPGQNLSVLLRIQVKCANSTLSNIIGVYPQGFSQSSIYQDPYDKTINIFMVNYSASASQVGQNLFCFAGVDSIGNQADSTCLRFTVQVPLSSLNTLYFKNATRFPTGTVSKYQSNWTLLYPSNTTYVRPTTEALIRFKLLSTQQDYFTLNVVTQPSNVLYLSDRLLMYTTTLFLPGQNYCIIFDPGVFLPIATCFRDSMGITDTSFWTINIPAEAPTTLITTTTTVSSTTTLKIRT
ncbi:unnamed protein product, partial [Didymodactylos carnosus]